MIPAKTTCPSGWIREHYGYLMSESTPNRRSEYACVDMTMESIPGSYSNVLGGHFWQVEAHCNGLACPITRNLTVWSAVNKFEVCNVDFLA